VPDAKATPLKTAKQMSRLVRLKSKVSFEGDSDMMAEESNMGAIGEEFGPRSVCGLEDP